MKITFKASDFKGNSYLDNADCAIARAMRRAGADVVGVCGEGWVDCDDILHPLTKSGQRLDYRLSLLSESGQWRKRNNPFIGKSFYV